MEEMKMEENRYELNKNLAQMLKGGVIMDVTTPEQARIAEGQAHAQSWRWREYLRTYVRQGAFQG